MLAVPKGYKYWQISKNGKTTIIDSAPDWAKKEFEEYQKLTAEPSDKKGIQRQY